MRAARDLDRDFCRHQRVDAATNRERAQGLWSGSRAAPDLHPPQPRTRIHLGEVRALLRLADARDVACSEVMDLAIVHREEIRTKIADLRRMQWVLEALIARCQADDQVGCPLVETLFSDAEPASRDRSTLEPARAQAARTRAFSAARDGRQSVSADRCRRGRRAPGAAWRIRLRPGLVLPTAVPAGIGHTFATAAHDGHSGVALGVAMPLAEAQRDGAGAAGPAIVDVQGQSCAMEGMMTVHSMYGRNERRRCWGHGPARRVLRRSTGVQRGWRRSRRSA